MCQFQVYSKVIQVYICVCVHTCVCMYKYIYRQVFIEIQLIYNVIYTVNLLVNLFTMLPSSIQQSHSGTCMQYVCVWVCILFQIIFHYRLLEDINIVPGAIQLDLVVYNFYIQWRKRQWQPTPVLLPGKSHGRRTGGLQSMGSHRVRHD